MTIRSWLRVVFVFAIGFVGLAGLGALPACSCEREFEVKLASDSLGDAAFEGTWTKVLPRGSNGTIREETYDVVADGVHYRVVRHRENFDDITVYDGSDVFEQSVQTADDFDGVTTEGRVNVRALSDATLSRTRFWARDVRGSEQAGERVCGRPTRYFANKVKDERPFLEVWLDAEHDVMLRRVETVLAPGDAANIDFDPSRIGEIPEDRLLIREWRCDTIRFGRPDESSFDRPSEP